MHVGLARELDALWESTTSPPDVFAFLAQHAELLPRQRAELVRCDQRHRWQSDQPLAVEDYLAGLPDLAVDPELKLQLVTSEFQARLGGGGRPSIDEFLSRFPDLGERLERELSAFVRGEPKIEQPLSDETTRTLISAGELGDQQIGRYRLIRVLGEGGFGRVWLGFDEELRRLVAIKVPTPERFETPEDAESYLAEARTLATLDHPNIVPVYDVGRAVDGSVYIVSKFIEGCDLGEIIEQDRPKFAQSAELLATIAQALDHAHQRRLIHRDIKPANILIQNSTQTPYVADFGLAVSEEDHLRNRHVAGTPAYMSPEQARGEGHRIDGRSDIFSLGVVLYELLTGKRPFRGSTRNELLHQVIAVDPTPPREFSDRIPNELERICLKALAKRAADRYATAGALADDLRSWRQQREQVAKQSTIVPKGLRSFDADDADFFLELLPGPRDREGLPESIRFWKTRLEETEPDKTFSVGLLYGPSGCGKSSLVKAGLLPRLSQEVTAAHVEATAEGTETRILLALRKRLPALPRNLQLVETLAVLRRGEGKKVVIVLDQFEQWLHAHRGEQDTKLVRALRQCDGGRVQAIVLVRDDFSMAASRFMNELEARIVEGHNFATVDLFDIDHAQKVLTQFGQAFGRLPPQLSRFTNDEQKFLSSVTKGLAQDGKVVCVRLALFAEMVKGKPWVPATLQQVGGTRGIGVNFLEETFSSRQANPQHRLHQQAARAVLQALLPEVGTDIKGHMRSHAELLEASGYRGQSDNFNDLVRILDGELRLITPTDPEGVQTDSGYDSRSRFYQLTHDYLVPALRDWLTRKQKETRRGRAELQLAERAARWNAKPENRQLPSLWEYLNIRLLTSAANWSEPQRQMMKRAGRVHRIRPGVMAALLVAVLLTARELTGRFQASSLVDQLTSAEIAQVPAIIDRLDAYRSWANPLLRREEEQARPGSNQKLHAALALLPVDAAHVAFLQEQLVKVTPGQFPVVRDALASHKDDVIEPLWSLALDPNRPTQERFQAVCALASYAPTDKRWMEINPLVAGHLVSRQASEFLAWREALRPARSQLIQPLASIYRDPGQREQTRLYSTETLADYAADRPHDLFDALADAEPFQFATMFDKFVVHKGPASALAEQELEKPLPQQGSEDEKEALARRKANAAVTLFRLGQPDNVWRMLKFGPDPRVRSYIIHWLSPLGGTPQGIVERLKTESDVTIRRALVLMLGEFTDQLSAVERASVTEDLLDTFEHHPDPGLHGAAEWLLRKWGHAEQIEAVLKRLRMNEDQLQARQATDSRKWYVNTQGQTFAIVDAGEFVAGSPRSEPGHDGSEMQFRRRINRRLAISTTEVTKAQYDRSRPPLNPLDLKRVMQTEDSAQVAVTWYEAAAYCNWLSEQEGVAKHEWCYEPNAEGKFGPGMKVKAGFVELVGYRLPTEWEWEYACRAGTTTSRYFGLTETILPKYAWFSANGRGRAWPVGSLKPNDLGLSDTLGNVWEWCNDRFSNFNPTTPTGEDVVGKTLEDRRVLRGGAFSHAPGYVRASSRDVSQLDYRNFSSGFRPARTLSALPKLTASRPRSK